MPRSDNQPDPRRAYQRGRILNALQGGSLTARQIAAELYLSLSGVQLHLAALRDETPRLVRVAGFAPAPVGHRRAPVYGLGDAPDAKYPKSRAPKGRVTEAERHDEILKMLCTQQMTAAEVVERLGLQRARIYVFRLHAEGKIHIVAYRPNPIGGTPPPVYAAGSAPDAARPAPQTGHEKCARYWAKLKADEHRYGLYLFRNRIRKTPQTWFSALTQ